MNLEHQWQRKKFMTLFRKTCPGKASTDRKKKKKCCLPQDSKRIKKKKKWQQRSLGGKIAILNTFLHMSETN